MVASRCKSRIILCLTLLLASMAPLAHASATGSLVEPVQLKQWIDNGYRTEKGERVVIVNVVPAPSDKVSWFAGDVARCRYKPPFLRT